MAKCSALSLTSLAIATNAGELFVEYGISVKKRSPFPHTILSELTNESVGYQPTPLAFEHEGYETLAGVNFIAADGFPVRSTRWGHNAGRAPVSPDSSEIDPNEITAPAAESLKEAATPAH
jgi:hypothetical protein